MTETKKISQNNGGNMHEVVIAGIGQTKVGEHWELSLRELSFHALEAAMIDAGGLVPQAMYVANMMGPAFSRQSHLGSLVADFAGLSGIESVVVEAAGASGGAAIRQAYLAIKSGLIDVVCVVGVEKSSEQTQDNVLEGMANLLDNAYEGVQGLTPAAQAALLMRRYFHEYDVPEHAMGAFQVNAHANGAGNKNAMFQKAIKQSLYERVGPLCDPMNMFDASPDADGAAAIILARQDIIPEKFPHALVKVTGSSMVVDTLALHDRPDPLVFNASRLSIQKVFDQTGLNMDDLDLFELHDAFSIYNPLILEAAGLAEKGEGWKLGQDGSIALDGKLPINTLGGLKARGYPGGATGVYQAVEAAMQLRGTAGQNQLENAKTALIQCLGGPASTAATHILQV